MNFTNYCDLVHGDIPFYVYCKGENIGYRDLLCITDTPLNICPGSFNPRHAMHDLLYKRMEKFFPCGNDEHINAVYEICIKARNKFTLEYDELMRRLHQFDEDNKVVIVTNATYFREKAGVLRGRDSLWFHIGFDTAKRLVEDDGVYGVQGIRANFVVYPRDGVDIGNLPVIPLNFYRGSFGGEYVEGVSSTKIRDGEL
jgi:hypothetical protein